MPEPFVQEVLDDARRVASYGRHAGAFQDSALFQAIADADALPEPRASSPEVVRLQAILTGLAQAIPFAVQAALKKGWDPTTGYLSYPRRTYRLIALALLLMLATGSLTVTYNKGAALLSELEALSELGYRTRMDALIWKEAETRAQLANTSFEGASPTELALSREAHLSSVYEIRALSERMNSAYAQSVTFDIDARFPFPATRGAYCIGLDLFNEARQGLFGLADVADTACLPLALGTGRASLTPRLDPECMDRFRDEEREARDLQEETRSYYVRYTNEMQWTARRLGCVGIYNLGPQDLVPPLTTLTARVNEGLAPFALWLLPALYGAMGAMLFHLRQTLNPLQPDPPLARLVLRLSLGALAGIVLTWFFRPDSRLDPETFDHGFTLLGFAFLFGFSLDVFFTILDRFVAVSVASLQRVGTSTGTGPGTSEVPRS